MHCDGFGDMRLSADSICLGDLRPELAWTRFLRFLRDTCHWYSTLLKGSEAKLRQAKKRQPRPWSEVPAAALKHSHILTAEILAFVPIYLLCDQAPVKMWSSSSASTAARYGRLVASQIRHQKKDSASLFGGSGAVLAIAGAASASTTSERARVSHAVTARAYNTGASLVQRNGVRFGSMTNQIGRTTGRYNSTAASANASAASTSEAAAAANSKTGFVAWYESHLEVAPVRTKAVTGMILWGLGDIVAQLVPHFVFDEKKDTDSSSDNASHAKPFVYDYARTGRAALFGFAIHAPLSHVHYNFLEWMTVRAGFQGLSVPVFKTIMEQFVYWSWFSNSLYHGAMGALQGWTWEQCYDRIADVLWDTQKVSYADR